MQDFKTWLASPFQADMSALDWFLFVGLLIVIFTVWGFVFRHVKGDI